MGMLPFLKNLSSTEVFTGAPWEIKVSIPEKAMSDKAARDGWATNPKTDHCCYSAWQGTNPALRISTRKGSQNPPAVCLGLVLDFDYPATGEERQRHLSSIPLPVYAVEHTLTPGHWRAVLIFESPEGFASVEMARHFLQAVAKKWKLAGGFDRAAFEEPNRYYTSSGRFDILGGKVPKSEVSKLIGEVFRDYKFGEFSVGVDLSLESIEKALEEKFPEFRQKWTGPFTWEAQGPTFWIPQSASPKSAILKRNGFYTFSSSAEKSFYSWTELLGADFVNERRNGVFGQITERIYRTQRDYLLKMHDDVWRAHDKGDLVNYLRITLGLSSKVDDGGKSPIDEALAYIREFRRVDAIAPFLYDPREIIHLKGKKIINELAGRKLVLQPAPVPGVWGPTGNFPWLSHFLETLFVDSENALPYFLAWMSRFYKSGYQESPCSGHALGIAGGVGVGKTYLSTYLLPRIFGPLGHPIDYLTGDDKFGGQLFGCAIWSIDDGSVGMDYNKRKAYSERLKAAIANRGQRYHLKFQTPVEGLVWGGRIVITCNLDAHSVRSSFPNLDMSNRDKIMLFRAVDQVQAKFLPEDGHNAIVEKELPFFCKFLLDYQPPAHILATGANANRFGVRSYLEETLLEKLQLTSPLNNIASTLREFKVHAFEVEDGRKPPAYLDFTGAELFENLNQRFPNQFRGYNYLLFTQSMEALADAEDSGISAIIDGSSYVWRLYP